MNTKIYIASGFFDDHQNECVTTVETKFKERGINFFSPRLDSKVGPGMANTHEDKINTYRGNVENIDDATHMLAILDDKLDSGTLFEIGYAIAKGKPIALVLLGDKAESLDIFDKVDSLVITYDLNKAIDFFKHIKHSINTVMGIGFGGDFEDREDMLIVMYEDSSVAREFMNDTISSGDYAMMYNISSRKKDPGLVSMIGQSIAKGVKTIIYADDIKSANLMLALCTPYFVIGKEELDKCLTELAEGKFRTELRDTSELLII